MNTRFVTMIAVIGILVIGLLLSLSKTTIKLKGDLTAPDSQVYLTVHTLIDSNPQNNIRTIREFRRALTFAIQGVLAGNATYDLSRNNTVDVQDLRLFIQAIQYLRPCGNGQKVSAEQCDDGNTEPNDGCNAVCQIEDGFICNGNPSICVVNPDVTGGCGDGTVDVNLGEQCDDGNTVSGDGCSGTEANIPNGACQHEFCGDGFRDADGFGNDPTTIEACDDGGKCQGGPNDGASCTGYLDDAACGETGTCMKVNTILCTSSCTIPSP